MRSIDLQGLIVGELLILNKKITNMPRILFSLLILISALPVFGQGIEFYDGDWKDALAEAEKSEKLVFVDAYAVWCGPCKRMAKTTFKEKEVGDFFNANFINLKIDMERGHGLTFGSKYPVSAFPTLMFLNGKGEVIHKTTGAKDVAKLMSFAKKAMGMDDRSGDYEVAYNEGKRDFDLVYKYVQALNKVGKPSSKVVNDYIRSKPNITDEQMTKFLLVAVTEADSKAFEELVKRKGTAEKLTGEESVKDAIVEACKKTVNKAIEYESEMLLTEAQNKMKASYKSDAKAFEYESKIIYYKGLGYTDRYLETVQDYCSKIIKKDAEAINDLAEDISKNLNRNKKALEVAEDLAKDASKKGKKADYYMTYAKILNQNEKKDDALKAANKALEITKDNNEPTNFIEGFIRYLEAS